MKVKQCTGEGCSYQGNMYQSKPLLCKNCAMKAKTEQPKRSKLVYSTNKAISPVSEKQAKKLAEYRKVRDQFLNDNPFCKVCGTPNDITLHHGKGRIGDLLTDVTNFVTLCAKHHEQAEREPFWAKEIGISKSRLES